MKGYHDIVGDGGSRILGCRAAHPRSAARARRRHLVAVGSGKGGVGKSSSDTASRRALSEPGGSELGSLDAGHGPSQARVSVPGSGVRSRQSESLASADGDKSQSSPWARSIRSRRVRKRGARRVPYMARNEGVGSCWVKFSGPSMGRPLICCCFNLQQMRTDVAVRGLLAQNTLLLS